MSAGDGNLLPSSNRGVSENERIPVIVDYLAVAVDLREALTNAGWEKAWSTTRDDLNDEGDFCVPVARALVDHLFNGCAVPAEEAGKGRFYRYRVKLNDAAGQYVGLVELGGTETCRKDGTYTARIELTGQGCRLLESSMAGLDHAERWSSVAGLLGMCGTRITRVDLAADDLDGVYSLQWALDRYQAGEFDKRGQRPKLQEIKHHGSKDGDTLYVGSRKSENLLRVYEKGREQGDPDSPWVRYEAEFHGSSRRELPLEMLVACDAYLRGAYNVLHFVGGVGERLRSVSAATLANAKRAIRTFKHQYGPFANLILAASEGCEQVAVRLLRGCSRSAMPQWFKGRDDLHEFREAIPV